ncbi:hypothetical protein HanPSC8_Chr17g0795451 [Helianthus annuus]|nr:hypothetical protein HanPSC8_Chr17g0795451 [Helianthus annuus]
MNFPSFVFVMSTQNLESSSVYAMTLETGLNPIVVYCTLLPIRSLALIAKCIK